MSFGDFSGLFETRFSYQLICLPYYRSLFIFHFIRLVQRRKCVIQLNDSVRSITELHIFHIIWFYYFYIFKNTDIWSSYDINKSKFTSSMNWKCLWILTIFQKYLICAILFVPNANCLSCEPAIPLTFHRVHNYKWSCAY